MKGLLDSLRKLGMAPILALTGVLIGMIGIVAFLELGGVSTSRMVLLYSDLDPHDSGQIVDQLEHHQIPYRVEADGKRIMVAADDVFSARALLAKEGLPASGLVRIALNSGARSSKSPCVAKCTRSCSSNARTATVWVKAVSVTRCACG